MVKQWIKSSVSPCFSRNFCCLNCLYLDPWGFPHLFPPEERSERAAWWATGTQPRSTHEHLLCTNRLFHNASTHFITDPGAQAWKCTILKVNTLNHFKISLHLLHIKIKSARTRRLKNFWFYFYHFELTLSTLRDSRAVSTPRRVQLQAEAGERCHSPSQVIWQLGEHTDSTGAGTEHPLPLVNHESEHSPALLEKVLCSDFTFLTHVLHAAIENPPRIRSTAVLNKGTWAKTHTVIFQRYQVASG